MATNQQISVNSIPINFVTQGEGEKAIVFVHGNSCAINVWNSQLNDVGLQRKYRLIAFDLPGHGKSGKSSGYEIANLAASLSGFVNALNLKDFILVGQSYGTIIVAEALPALKGCRGVLMVAPNIVGKDFPLTNMLVPFPEMHAITAATISDADLLGIAQRLSFSPTSPIVDQYQKSYLETDPNVRLTLGSIIAEQAWNDETEIIKQSGLPVCFVFGKDERVINTHYLDNFEPKWGGKIFYIDNAAHWVNDEQPGQFNDLLIKFASDVFV
jgi:pimeloyl-ACP methyl ester carboxylesterase